MKRAPMILLPIILVVSLVAFTSCGSDDDGNEGTKTTATDTSGDMGEMSKVVMSEFKFEPSDVSVKQGSMIDVPNEGSVDHDLKVRKKGGDDLGGIDVIPGGKSEMLTVDFEPGEYEMYCSVPGHEESGMVGTFTVK